MRNILISFALTFLATQVSSEKYPHIGACYYYYFSPFENLTLVCVDTVRQHNFFTPGVASICLNQHLYSCCRDGYLKSWIKNINFQDCEQPELPNNLFQVYENLDTFDMSHLGLTSLPVNMFSDASKLISLNVSHNEITEIPSFLFQKNEKLSEIDFSFNKIKVIDDYAFAGDSNLEKLNMSHNEITEIPSHLFDKIEQLVEVDFSFNRISKISPEAFTTKNQFKYLDLSNNNISKLNAMNFRKIEKLKLSHNKISEIPPFLFLKAEDLMEIDFSFNKIGKISAFALAVDVNLQILSFFHNQITELGRKLFQDQVNLKSLDLSRNLIRKMDTETFENLLGLKYLNLSHNKLIEIQTATFSPLRRLQTLDLSDNKLKTLNAGSFPTQLNELALLSIANNQLREINDLLLVDVLLPSCKIVGIDSNNFNCLYLNHIFHSIPWKHLDSVSKLIECGSITEQTNSFHYSETTTNSGGIETSTVEGATHTNEKIATVDSSTDQQTEGVTTLQTAVVVKGIENGGDHKGREDEKSGTKNHHKEYYFEAGLLTHLIAITWVIAICLILIVLGLTWFILRKQLQKENIFTSVLYRRNNEEQINVIENDGYDMSDGKAGEI